MFDRLADIPSQLIAWRTCLMRRLGNYVPGLKRNGHSVKAHAGAVVDLFGTILSGMPRGEIQDADAALDMLRYTFPEVEHRWLTARFEHSLHTHLTITEVLASAAAGRDERERMAIALEVLTLLIHMGDEYVIDSLFDQITYGLELPGTAKYLRRLLTVPGTPAQEPAYSVSFGTEPGADVLLPAADAGVRFRVIRCSQLVLVVNDGDKSLIVRGRHLAPHGVMPVTNGQMIVLPSGTLSFEEFSFFLNCKRSGKQEVLYLSLDDEGLQVSRTRSRLSQLRILLGLACTIEPLKPEPELRVNRQIVPVGQSVQVTYDGNFYLGDEGPFAMVDVHTAMSEFGRRFRIDPGVRKLRVTNLPEQARKGDMLLTPGLAPGVVLGVEFSGVFNSGTLEVIEGSMPPMLNGRAVRGKVALQDGDIVQLNDYQAVRCRFSAGVLDEEYHAIRTLSVEGVSKNFLRAGRVVDNLDFSVKRGEMVCILGPSGSGKSTVLAMLAGHLPPTSGVIYYNNQSLYAAQERIRPYIAFIPREDILDGSMSVAEHIAQATVVRRPKLSRHERNRRVAAILKFLGLTGLASRRVGEWNERTISDGERTRVNLGLDLVGIADVFLLDEPISGLSTADAKLVMQSLRSMSRDKMIIASMHRPSATILNQFHKVLVLDHNGQMAYWGDVPGMEKYFRHAARDLGIDISAAARVVGGADLVFEVLEAPLTWHTRRRRKHPHLWQERFEGFRFRSAVNHAEGNMPMTVYEGLSDFPAVPKRKWLELWRLFRIWVMRTLLGRIRSRMSLYTMLLEGPLLALLIALTLRAAPDTAYSFATAWHIPAYLFLATVVAMFFGLTGAAGEVLKDRAVLKRESNTKVFVTGYILAKAVVLTGLATLQSALFLWIGNTVLAIPEMFLYYLSTMSLTAFVGVSLSLLVSVFAKTERATLNMVPLLLIPQILLAGAMIRFDEMNQFIPWSAHRTDAYGRLKPGRVPVVAEFCPLRYAFETMVVDQATRNVWERERLAIQEHIDALKDNPDLTDRQFEQFKLLKMALLHIAAVGAQSPQHAKTVLRSVRRQALAADQPAYDKLMAQLEQTGHALPAAKSYFVNNRIVMLDEAAEIQRVSKDNTDSPSIFLARRQPLPWAGSPSDASTPATDTVATGTRNNIILFLMGCLPLWITGRVMKRKLERSK